MIMRRLQMRYLLNGDVWSNRKNCLLGGQLGHRGGAGTSKSGQGASLSERSKLTHIKQIASWFIRWIYCKKRGNFCLWNLIEKTSDLWPVTPVTPYWVQVMHTGLPCAMKEAARKICKNAKKLKVEDGSEVAMAAVAVLFGKTQIQHWQCFVCRFWSSSPTIAAWWWAFTAWLVAPLFKMRKTK